MTEPVSGLEPGPNLHLPVTAADLGPTTSEYPQLPLIARFEGLAVRHSALTKCGDDQVVVNGILDRTPGPARGLASVGQSHHTVGGGVESQYRESRVEGVEL